MKKTVYALMSASEILEPYVLNSLLDKIKFNRIV